MVCRQIKSKQKDPVIAVNNGFNIKITGTAYPADTRALLNISGNSKNILIEKSGLKAGTSWVHITPETTKKEVMIKQQAGKHDTLEENKNVE